MYPKSISGTYYSKTTKLREKNQTERTKTSHSYYYITTITGTHNTNTTTRKTRTYHFFYTTIVQNTFLVGVILIEYIGGSIDLAGRGQWPAIGSRGEPIRAGQTRPPQNLPAGRPETFAGAGPLTAGSGTLRGGGPSNLRPMYRLVAHNFAVRFRTPKYHLPPA